jgi:hypothetical protein
MKRLIPTILILILFPTHSVFAESSAEYASKAQMAWSAFECAALASFMGKNIAEHKMLFELGYNEGKAFLTALGEKKISQEDLKSKVPIYFGLLISGPNHDFVLGRLFELIVHRTGDKITGEIVGGIANQTDELTQMVASRLFDEQNCLLINPDFPNIK